MRKELDERLCADFPKLFRDRGAPMTETCLCWGFACGDGWYNIIYALCLNIQNTVDHTRRQRATAIRYNRALKKAIAGDDSWLLHYFNYGGTTINDYTIKLVSDAVTKAEFREVPAAMEQIVVSQVKEKFGTLRFYTHRGNDEIWAMIGFAETLSGMTCESCGCPATIDRNDRGWVSTLCDTCKDKPR